MEQVVWIYYQPKHTISELILLLPRDLFPGILLSMKNGKRMVKDGAGWIWEKKSRLNQTHHIGLWDHAKLMVTILRKGKKFEDKLEELAKETDQDCRKK